MSTLFPPHVASASIVRAVWLANHIESCARRPFAAANDWRDYLEHFGHCDSLRESQAFSWHKFVVFAAVSELGSLSRRCLDAACQCNLQGASDAASITAAFIALFKLLDAMAPHDVRDKLLWVVSRSESSKQEALLLGLSLTSRRLTLDPRLVAHARLRENFRQRLSDAYEHSCGGDGAASLSDGSRHHESDSDDSFSVSSLFA
ncbi:hypothetical protein DFH08DRAFT_976581 [Mycena albidolilacea]|uniref:Uncharacterized protein n=1 Tax=Mycena albidolilacea TaxID=1033008 RepID=A0AAD6Z2C3_9AGAR|nr:hypothetical protein DFH08DRAFT_976581 [Mycena albidolilacea]